MKKFAAPTLPLLLPLLLAAALAGPRPAAAQQRRPKPAKTRAAAVAELLVENEKRTWALYQSKDVKGLAALIGDDYYDVYPTGEAVDKKRYLADVAGTDVKDYELSGFEVRMLNEAAAVVVYRARVHASVGGREVKSVVAVTSAWARRGGRWLNVFYRENAVEVDGRRLL